MGPPSMIGYLSGVFEETDPLAMSLERDISVKAAPP